MALNFSRRPIFPGNGCGLEGGSEDRFCNPLLSDGDAKDCFDYGRDRCKSGGCSQESISNDILDLLPSDPFGMEISTTFTAITGWLEDLEMDYGGYGCDMVGGSSGDYQLFAGLNLLWNNAMKFQTFPGSVGFDSKFNVAGGIGGYNGAKEAAGRSCDVGFGLGDMNELYGHSRTEEAGLRLESARLIGAFGEEMSITGGGNASRSTGFQSLGDLAEDDGSFGTVGSRSPDCHESFVGTCSDGNGMTHEAWNYALSSLGVRDLLSVESVCRSLRAIVQSDSLLWRNIHISQPLNEKVTDDILMHLTNRAEGQLQCLSLIECSQITEDGLKQVLLSNPSISKLCVPGCTRLSINGIIEILRMCKSMGTRVKHLRIGGLYGVTPEHFAELKQLLGVGGDEPLNVHRPHFYNRGNQYLSCDDDRAIDIEVCPRCQKIRLVYDCPAEVCQGKEHDASQLLCRACLLCIERCVQCGRCINDGEYEETFCLEKLCSACSVDQQLKCQQMQVEEGGSSNPNVMNVCG